MGTQNNRDIKFRGKRIDNGEWVTGFYVEHGGNHFIKHLSGGAFLREFIEVHPDTVGQFTGLQDKNGVDIYEGDRLTNISGLKWIVKWFKEAGQFRLVYEEESGDCRMNQEWVMETEIEIIGTIHDKEQKL